ncbi:MAG: SufD family Fe-S cluster assembly protein, partial [Candidatus Aenigmarchaeota archaeon]|nr:SufD family Fe-S cluster assembly protein [Candidatus Aenigmarchaeota archaeon]
ATTKRNFSRVGGWNLYSKASSDLGFARIDSITPLGIEPTYDIEVEGRHNFVANGIVVHNSCVTMLYPSSVLLGPYARADYLGIAFAGANQNQDTGSKVYHLAPHTTSTIRAKSISKDGGITSYRGLVQINKGSVGCKSSVSCDALMIDEKSVSNTFPYMKINEDRVDVAHEATVGRISAEQLFYLMSRGLTEEKAMQMIVSGFIEPVVKELPLEYAVELNRLVEMEMEGAVG